jgi:hypothetical protein
MNFISVTIAIVEAAAAGPKPFDSMLASAPGFYWARMPV